MSINNVAIIGANGKIGEFVLDALVESGFKVTVLQRQSSKSKPAHQDRITKKSIPDDLPLAELKSALHGQDAVVNCMPVKDVGQHLRFAEAVATTGAKRYIPADFGSVDAASKLSQDLVPLYVNRMKIQDRLDELVKQHPSFSWTSLVNGHFFDWGLRENFLHFDLKKHHADILGSGDQKSSLSTLTQIAKATIKVLRDLEHTENKRLFIQSFLVSQNEVLESLEKASGQKWDVARFDTDDFVKQKKQAADGGDKGAVEDLVFALGVIDGDWTQRPEYAMALLGLQEEDLDTVVSAVVKSLA